MPKCGICGGDAPEKPSVTLDGKCDQCGRMIVLEEDRDKIKCGLCGGEAPRQPIVDEHGTCEFCSRKVVLREERVSSVPLSQCGVPHSAPKHRGRTVGDAPVSRGVGEPVDQ